MLFWLAVFKMHEKKLLIFKTAKMAFFAVNNFFGAFSKIPKKNMRVFIFFKAESEPKHEEKFILGGFSTKTKNALFWG